MGKTKLWANLAPSYCGLVLFSGGQNGIGVHFRVQAGCMHQRPARPRRH